MWRLPHPDRQILAEGGGADGPAGMLVSHHIQQRRVGRRQVLVAWIEQREAATDDDQERANGQGEGRRGQPALTFPPLSSLPLPELALPAPARPGRARVAQAQVSEAEGLGEEEGREGGRRG